MDIATVGGMVGGMAVILAGILVAGGDLMLFWDPPSVFVTVGGSVGALFVAYPLGYVLGIMKIMGKVISTQEMKPDEMINMLVTFSEKARREGLLALEDDVEEVKDDFLKKGIQLVVDGTDPELVRIIMNTELNKIDERHTYGKEFFEFAGLATPAFGMIGTLMGLIMMLANLEDKSAIGSGMATALLTTMYGAIIANLLLNPIAKKLESRHTNEILLKEIMLEGTLSIQSGDNPRIVKDKLASFLAPDVRDKISVAETGA